MQKKKKDIAINKRLYQVNEKDFKFYEYPELVGLKLHKDVGKYQRIISFLNEIQETFHIQHFISISPGCGGFIPIELSKSNAYETIFIQNVLDKSQECNIFENIKRHCGNNLFYDKYKEKCKEKNGFQNSIIFNDWGIIDDDIYQNINVWCPFFLSVFDHKLERMESYINYSLKNTEFKLYLPKNKKDIFIKNFHWFVDEHSSEIDYTNLIHFCMIVKNAGEQLEEMLTQNLPFIDRWTIIDTGSTDNTINIIHKTLSTKKGQLIQEPFVDFSTTRNRCLDLAGTKCKYIIMLDDTYYLNGDLRCFFEKTQDDIYADSFSIFINTSDVTYASNRIIVSQTNLRYKYRVHEVIEEKGNINVIVPKEKAFINDLQFDFMKQRTKERNENDLKLLFDDLKDDPNNPRTYYYIAQTYLYINNYEKAYEFFLKRAKFAYSGYIQERFDAVFEAARISHYNLKKEWSATLALYEIAIKIDDCRPEPYYYIGIYEYENKNDFAAYQLLQKAFNLGSPMQTQYAIKPTIYYHFVPKFLTKLCYQFKNYNLGYDASSLYLKYNDEKQDAYLEMQSWNVIFENLKKCNFEKIKTKTKINIPEKPIIAFLCDDISSNDGLIEIVNAIHSWDLFKIIIFCNVEKSSFLLENVSGYGISIEPINNAFAFLFDTFVHTCIVFKNLYYLPVALKSISRNVYFLMEREKLHPCCVIPMEPKLKAIFCMTEKCKTIMCDNYPLMKQNNKMIVFQEGKRISYNAKQILLESLQNYHSGIINTFLQNIHFEEEYHFGMVKIGGYKKENDELYNCIKNKDNTIFVEPIKMYYEELRSTVNTIIPDNKFIFANVCISNNNGKMNLFYPSVTNEGPIPIFYSNNRKQLEERKVYCDLDSVWVKTITINQLWKDFQIKDVFLLIIETDFHDFEIIMNIDFNVVRPRYIKFANQHMTGFENRGPKYNLILNYLEKNNYKMVEETSCSTIVQWKNYGIL